MADYKIEAKPGIEKVIFTRIINAPREVVFKTVTDPLLVPEWWGPRRLTTAVHKMTVMPGGTWRYVQTDKEGKEYAFHGVYHDVVIPERLVYTSEYEGMPGHVALNIEEYAEQDGKTTITTSAIFQSVEDRDQFLQQGMEEGVSEMTLRLNELLAGEKMLERDKTAMDEHQKHEECITISRTFDAPRELVWERWTDPSQYMCWWGPKDFTAPYARFDLRPGGKYLSCMKDPDGKEYWGTGTFEEIDRLNRIVYTDNFADEHGNIVPPSYYGMGPDQPVEMVVEVTFEDLGDRTKMTVEHCGYPWGDMIEQAKEGWSQSFDKLAECLR